MKKRCVCGKAIPYKWSLCARCSNIHGMDRDKWPEWLTFQVNDIQREINAMRNNPDAPYYDGWIYHGTREGRQLHSEPIVPGREPRITSLLEDDRGTPRGCYDPRNDPNESEYRRLCGPPESRGYTEECAACGRPSTPKNELCTICRWPYL